MSQYRSGSGDSQLNPQDQPQTVTVNIPNSDQVPHVIQTDYLNAQALVLLDKFYSKIRPVTIGELRSDNMHCTICTEPFLSGESPEIPIMIKSCGHVFGMICIFKWLLPDSWEGNNSCPNCRMPVIDFSGPGYFVNVRTTRAHDTRNPDLPIQRGSAAPTPMGSLSATPARTPASTALMAQPGTTVTSVTATTATPHRVARNSPTSVPTIEMQEAQVYGQVNLIFENIARNMSGSSRQTTAPSTRSYTISPRVMSRPNTVEHVETDHTALEHQVERETAVQHSAQERSSGIGHGENVVTPAIQNREEGSRRLTRAERRYHTADSEITRQMEREYELSRDDFMDMHHSSIAAQRWMGQDMLQNRQTGRENEFGIENRDEIHMSAQEASPEIISEETVPNSTSTSQDEGEQTAQRLREAKTRLREAEARYEEARIRSSQVHNEHWSRKARRELRRMTKARIAVDRLTTIMQPENERQGIRQIHHEPNDDQNGIEASSITAATQGVSANQPALSLTTENPPEVNPSPNNEDESIYTGITAMFAAAEAEHEAATARLAEHIANLRFISRDGSLSR